MKKHIGQMGTTCDFFSTYDKVNDIKKELERPKRQHMT